MPRRTRTDLMLRPEQRYAAPAHLIPYLAKEPPTLTAEEQEHADRLVREIAQRDAKEER